jgi:transposase
MICPRCGGDVSDAEAEGLQHRQVIDLPPIRLEVTEHQAETKCCPHCRASSTAAFPSGVDSPMQYGERLKGLLIYLHQYQLLPYQRSCELVEDVCGQSVSEGTLANANAQCHETLAPVEQAIIQYLQAADVVNFDETSLFEQGERRWLHSASTNEVTYYFAHAKRGKEGSDAAGVLPEFHGRAMHDHWATYQTYQEMEHAFCNAHHLRELDRAAEQDEARWAEKMRDLLCRIKARVEEAKAHGLTRLPRQETAMFYEWYCSILFDAYVQDAAEIEGDAQPPPSGRRRKQSKEKNLRDRLYRYAFETLAFMYDFRVPFDNNLAERDIRMTKVKQKISGGFRSPEGLEHFCRIRGFISTIKKQGGNILEALSATFQGRDMLQFVRLETPE